MRKSGSGRSGEVALPYVQTAFRTTVRTGSGIVGTSVARLRIAELLHELPRFGLDLVDLLARQVAAPALLHERRRHVSRIPDHVHDRRLRIGAQRRGKDERRLGRLLYRTEPPHEAVTPDALEHPAQLGGGGLLLGPEEHRDRRLPHPELAQVREAGHLPDRAGDEARARARRTEHEDRPLRGEVDVTN